MEVYNYTILWYKKLSHKFSSVQIATSTIIDIFKIETTLEYKLWLIAFQPSLITGDIKLSDQIWNSSAIGKTIYGD